MIEALLWLIGVWAGLILLSIALWRLPPAIFMPAKSLSPTLLLPHDDWPWPFKKLSRRISAFPSDRMPVKLLGNAPRGTHYDVPQPGTWVIAFPWHVAWQTKNRWYVRLPGLRWDYEDPEHYYNFGATVKHYVN